MGNLNPQGNAYIPACTRQLRRFAQGRLICASTAPHAPQDFSGPLARSLPVFQKHFQIPQCTWLLQHAGTAGGGTLRSDCAQGCCSMLELPSVVLADLTVRMAAAAC